MMGAIAGDVVGSIYESKSRNIKTKDFALFEPTKFFTDDTVMTVAVADALLDGADIGRKIRKWARAYPRRGYGGYFRRWMRSEDPQPYNSYGNGSAMRVSAAGWLAQSEAQCVAFARASAAPTHGHPEGIKGAEATAWAIWGARAGASAKALREGITRRYGYDLSRTCDEIRPDYAFDVTCQGTCPQAFTAALEAEDFEDALRLAISLGGDADTLAAIAGSIAEARFGIPESIRATTLGYLDTRLLKVIARFYAELAHRGISRETRDL